MPRIKPDPRHYAIVEAQVQWLAIAEANVNALYAWVVKAADVITDQERRIRRLEREVGIPLPRSSVAVKPPPRPSPWPPPPPPPFPALQGRRFRPEP